MVFFSICFSLKGAARQQAKNERKSAFRMPLQIVIILNVSCQKKRARLLTLHLSAPIPLGYLHTSRLARLGFLQHKNIVTASC